MELGKRQQSNKEEEEELFHGDAYLVNENFSERPKSRVVVG